MPPNGRDYTPTQQRIMDVLNDGRLHPASALMACLNDELTSSGTLHAHIAYLRKRLRPRGGDIVARYHDGGSHYQLVRLISTSE